MKFIAVAISIISRIVAIVRTFLDAYRRKTAYERNKRIAEAQKRARKENMKHENTDYDRDSGEFGNVHRLRSKDRKLH